MLKFVAQNFKMGLRNARTEYKTIGIGIGFNRNLSDDFYNIIPFPKDGLLHIRRCYHYSITFW